MKRVLAITLTLLSIVILLISGFQNKAYKINKINAEIVNGDIKILGENKYFMDSYNFTDTTRLNISKEGVENSIYSNILRGDNSYQAFNIEFKNNKNYPTTNDKYSGITSNGEPYSIIYRYLSSSNESYIDINLLTENATEQNIKVNYREIFESDDINSSNYIECMAANLYNNEIVMLLKTSKLMNEERRITIYKLLQIKLSDESVSINNLDFKENEFLDEKNRPQVIFGLSDDKIYILINQNNMRTTIATVDINDTSNFEIIYDWILDEVYSFDKNLIESFTQENKFENRMEIIKIFSNGTSNVVWVDMKTGLINEIQNIKSIDENILYYDKLRNIQINQVFTTGDDIFINYSSDTNTINPKNNLKFIDLETSKIELFIETNLNNSMIGKFIS